MQGQTVLGVDDAETKKKGLEADPEFRRQWVAVMQHFNCTKAERHECWRLAKKDPEAARASYALMAKGAWLRSTVD
ncbi:MAG: hypothetical protein K2Q07_07475 [Burkholderiaceae bacterium]|nr:hypothetical protein [Burkholderiaceae bacterium]